MKAKHFTNHMIGNGGGATTEAFWLPHRKEVIKRGLVNTWPGSSSSHCSEKEVVGLVAWR